MQNYIKNVVKEIIQKNERFENIKIILPSKRAVTFIKNEFKNQLNKTHFLPNVISIEIFIEEISRIQKADNIALLFEFYEIYLSNINNDDIEPFEEFINWASVLIKDFNEIDSYLVDTKNIFSYLKDINRIEQWFKNNKNQNELSLKYIQFFNKIELYYNVLYQQLLNKKIGYQGLQYREATKNIAEYVNKHNNTHYIFIGFNALNTSEEKIITTLLNKKIADIYFDIDQTLLEEGIIANKFIKSYKKQWSYYKKTNFKSITYDFKTEKNIKIIGLPKNITQIKYASEIIKKENTALILANENLLTTVINSLPKRINNVNITMGLPLKQLNLTDLFNLVFRLHLNKKIINGKNSFYYKDILSIINHPQLNLSTYSLVELIKSQNLIFINYLKLKKLNDDAYYQKLVTILFDEWTDPLDSCIQLLLLLKENTENNIELAYLNRFEQVFNQIQTLNAKYKYLKSLKGLVSIFNQIISSESIAFKGNALDGLQIMGMLETRVLAFDNIIITSVNEGFFPSGKTNNSFIPFDVKREKGIPTFYEKDAIFSYHFFRLIAKAKNIHLLYNTEPDNFGSGEKSRFIKQLELLQAKLPNLNIEEIIISPIITTTENELKQVTKNAHIIEKLKQANQKGFSPTSLTNYIYNPIAFYKQKILKIYQLNDFEETVAANTLGTIIHKVLETFYLPYMNKLIKVDDVISMKKQVNDTVKQFFKKEYENGDISKGKNLLIFEIAKQFIINFLNYEIQLLKQNNSIKIIGLEVDLNTKIQIEGVVYPINLMGQADRIDEYNGVIRIIDYKTGIAKQTNLNIASTKINNWHLLNKEHKYAKAFQVLMYAYMYTKQNNISLDHTKLESGIISFKNLKSGFMKVNKSKISVEDMLYFEDSLKELLTTIFDENVAFIENENLPY